MMRFATPDVRGVAVTARRALAADAVVVVAFPESGSGPPVVVSSAGLGEPQAERLGPALEAVARALDETPTLSVPSLLVDDAVGAWTFLRVGYAAVLATVAAFEGEPVGAIVALKSAPGTFDNEELVTVFARQAALSLARRRAPAPSVQQRLEGLAALDRLVLSVSTFAELSAALDAALAPLFDAVSTGIMVWDERREILQLLPGAFRADDATTAACSVSAFDMHSNSARVFTSGRAYISNDAREDAALLDRYVERFDIDRLLTIPLAMAGQTIGVLHIVGGARPFTVQDARQAEALAPKIAAAVELSMTMFRLRTQRRLEELLADVAVAVASGQRQEDLVANAFAELGDVIEASLLAVVFERGEPIVHRRGEVAPALREALLAEARTEPGMRAYVIAPGMPEVDRGGGWTAFHVPVQLGGRRLGTLAALRTRADPFSQEERHAMSRLANLVALAGATGRYREGRAELALLHERQRIAEDLHDDVAQILFAAQLSLDAALEGGTLDAEAARTTGQARGMLVRGDTAIRTVIERLSSPPAADIGHRLASAVSSVEQEFAQAIHLELPAEAVAAGKRLPRQVSDALVRVARESMVNAARHGGPCRVTVRLELPDQEHLELMIVDDGVGPVGRHGASRESLASLQQVMMSHGGTLAVRRGPTGGTRVVASVDL